MNSVLKLAGCASFIVRVCFSKFSVFSDCSSNIASARAPSFFGVVEDFVDLVTPEFPRGRLRM